MKEFQTQLLHYFSKSDNKSNHLHLYIYEYINVHTYVYIYVYIHIHICNPHIHICKPQNQARKRCLAQGHDIKVYRACSW